VNGAGSYATWYHALGWSADGRWVAWRKQWTDDGGEHLFLIDLRDVAARPMAEAGQRLASDPPDLPRLALRCRSRGGPPALGRAAPTVAVLGPDGLEVWDLVRSQRLLRAGGTKRNWPQETQPQHEPRLSFSADDRLLAVAAEVPEVLLLDAATGEEAGRIPHPHKAHWADFGPGGLLATSGGRSGRSVRLWDTATRKCVAQFKGPRSWCLRPLFQPSGRLLMTASIDEVFVWDTVALREVGRYDWGVGRVSSLDFAPDGQTAVVAGGRGKIVVWDLDF
jgi:WD40 repeat protein